MKRFECTDCDSATEYGACYLEVSDTDNDPTKCPFTWAGSKPEPVKATWREVASTSALAEVERLT